MSKIYFAAAALIILLGAKFLGAAEHFKAPPGRYSTSWVGNSFPGDGGPNGFGNWVQNGADEIEVTADGTVLAGTDWDEAGRCVGLYKDGKVNRVLLKQESKKETAWGWNTGNEAIAVDGTNIYIANKGAHFLRFSWTPGNLDSAKFEEEFEMPKGAVGLAARDGWLAIAYTNRLELRSPERFSLLASSPVEDLKDIVFAPDLSVWVIAGTNILKNVVLTNAVGKVEIKHDRFGQNSAFREVAKPTALSFDMRGRLIVCDDGPDQQVKFFEISGNPKLVQTFGERGGLRSGTAGLSAPSKLYSPRGAGTDAAGNLYVALGFNGAPVGTLVLRSFTPAGQLRWELANHAFVDTYGFDPESDGKVIYSRTAVFDVDLDSGASGLIWRQRATTVDHVKHPEDPRANSAMTAYLRRLEGRRLLYTIGQYGGGFRFFTFEQPDGYLAKPAGLITEKDETWAWHIASNGDVWHGDAPDKKIRRHAFRGWNPDGAPRFETEKPEAWPWPADFNIVRRIIYDDSTDTLYLSGYLEGEQIDSWGVAGKTLRRYDGWLKGKQAVRYTIKLPLNPDGEGKGKPLSPESLAIAGDYMFVGMVKPEDGKQPVHILKQADGSHVGTFVPGPEVGGNAGWQDMPYAVQAMRRKDGEYLILVEEDWRGKNLLYRWRPE
ncbi:MAG: hypothetical protein SFY81_14150 [Verrucomicrobiota bacterium]|nr:hypothetical protein [Verrucomicrobiota bacterium]